MIQRLSKNFLFNCASVSFLANYHRSEAFDKKNSSEYMYVQQNIFETDSIKNASQSLLTWDYSLVYSLIAVLLGALIICSIIGNSFVIAAIYLEKSLQNVANYLIVSLACADLMVAIIVMPFAAYQELSHIWYI